MQNRRGWCDSSTGFQPSPCASIRAPARQAIELNRRRLPRRARESEGGLRYTATADGPFLATRIPVSARTSQAWLRWFNSAFASRLFRVASIAAMQRSLKPQSTGQHRGDPPASNAECGVRNAERGIETHPYWCFDRFSLRTPRSEFRGSVADVAQQRQQQFRKLPGNCPTRVRVSPSTPFQFRRKKAD